MIAKIVNGLLLLAVVFGFGVLIVALEDPVKFITPAKQVFGSGYMTGSTYGTYYAGSPPALSAGQGAGLQMDQNGDLFVSVSGTVSCR